MHEGILEKKAYEWFVNIQTDGGITSMLYVLKKNPELLSYVVSMICTFAKGRLTLVLRGVLKGLYPSPLEYVTIINDFLHVLYRLEEAK